MSKQTEALAEQPAQPQPDEFLLRGLLASELKCWHRLTEDEAQNLVAFVQNMPAKPAQQQEPAFYRHEDGHLMTPDRAKFLGFDLNELQSLYTSPPAQRKPLTDEQIDAAVKAWFKNDIVAGRQPFAKRMRAAIEAAHGIKD